MKKPAQLSNPKVLYTVTIILGLAIGTTTALAMPELFLDEEEEEATFCQDVEDEVKNELPENASAMCHPPGVVQLDEIDDLEQIELECVCRFTIDNEVTLQPIYQTR